MFKLRQAPLIVVLAVALVASALILPWVDVGRSTLKAQSPRGAQAPAQPEIVLLTNLLGGFRGLLIDAVWLRAVKLQQAEKYWELYQLYDWMGKLEPYLEDIWEFNGWNMSYNLVAELPNSEARWQWIMRAIEWLRDQGLKYNPRSNKIMERIAWIFYHKIGRNLDIHNFYYKHRWALLMHNVLGDREMQDIPGIAEAPDDLDALLADEDVAEALKGFSLNPPEEAIEVLRAPEGLHSIKPDVLRALLNKGNEEAWRKVRDYVARYVLKNVYKMDRFDIMVKMEKDYGKFDWRLPEPHGIYWATLALECARHKKLQVQINYDRIVLFSLQEVMRRGIIAYLGPDPYEPMVTAFDLSKVAPIDKMYLDMLVKYDYWQRDDYGAKSIMDGQVQFLQEVSFDLYFAGYEKEAAKYHNELYKRYDKPHPYVPVGPYVMGKVKKLIDEYGTQAKVRAFIDGLINRVCVYLCLNRPNQARKYENLAKRGWIAYLDYDEQQRQGRVRHGKPLPSWETVLKENVRNILMGRSRAFPKAMIPRLRRILGVKKGAEMRTLEFGVGITPKVVPSSPPPK